MPRQSLLLVDSDSRSLRMLEVSLRKAGYDVTLALHGAEALEAIAQSVPDMILSDTRLPLPEGAPDDAPRDGYALCERLKAHDAWSRIPFVFLTGSGDLDDKIRGLKLGVEDYLTKPIYLKELLTRVQLLLARQPRDAYAGQNRPSFTGELGGMGLVDLLTTIELGRKSGVILIDSADGHGEVVCREGQVVDAVAGRHRGERAVFRMLLWAEGRFEAQFGATVLDERTGPDTITTHVQALMLEGLRRADEWAHLEGRLRPLDVPWVIDRDALARHEATLDAGAVALAARLDGERTAYAIVEACSDDLAALKALDTLYDLGIARRPGILVTESSPETPRSDRNVPPDDDVHFPELPEVEVTTTAMSGTNTASESHIERSATTVAPPHAVAASVNAAQTPPRSVDQARGQRNRNQERNVAKNKGKRSKGKSDMPHASRASEGSNATSAPSTTAPIAQSMVATPTTTATTPAAVSSAPSLSEQVADKGVRVEGNVIHLPVPAERARRQDDSGLHTAPKVDPSSDASQVDALREPEGERARTTLPPAEKGEAADAASDRSARGFFEPPTEKASEKRSPAKTDASKTDEKATEGKRAKLDIVVPRKDDLKRDRKESLSTHLSDEARAFFSEQAYQAAYKSEHDTFEDLTPATEEHPNEVARSRRWFTVTGAVFVSLVVAVVAIVLVRDRYAVRETALDTTTTVSAAHAIQSARSMQSAPTETEATAPPTQPAETTPAAPTGPAATVPAPPTAPPAAPTTPTEAAPMAPAPAAATPTVATETAAPPTAPTTPALAAPAANARELLAAARSFRGPLAGRIAAYDAYFNAAPGDDRTMTSFAMSLAEMSRNADAERIALRATEANPRNAQAWFVLAFTRNAQRNRDGAREARGRCVALGGQWAAECRALP